MDRYEAALERARQIKHDIDNIGCSMAPDMLDVIFPELAESENERARMWIYTRIEELRPANEDAEKELSKMKPLALAWLEKQKPAECNECAMFLSGECTHPNGKCKNVNPKQEWSEEDEKMLEEIINHIYTTSVQRIPARPGSDIGKSWIKFLKSLRPQSQKLEDWTEEDEELLKDVLGCITLVQTYKATGLLKEFKTNFSGEELRSFVRSLKSRPRKQPHWKPSEEQMEALLWCTAHLGGADHRVLAELYEHLKKL